MTSQEVDERTRQFIDSHRVARLATVDASGQPTVVPTFSGHRRLFRGLVAAGLHSGARLGEDAMPASMRERSIS
ncbi:MAG TPA: pyridoxamine 5'-phosphate oxidase family protein [Vicinamibacteria bacterium]|nr:pyridoxamine 5'-phosphate oxidase family protein [Vicinamibacteria bacterium]